MKKKDTYSTQNLYEASFLLSSGFKFISKEADNRKTTLYFEDSPELNRAVAAFYNGAGSMPAKSLFDSYRSLKDMIFQR